MKILILRALLPEQNLFLKMEYATCEAKTCSKCQIDKDVIDTEGKRSDFYNGKSICKKCYNERECMTELWTCNVCEITIRRRNRGKHEKSKRHKNVWFCNESYNYNRLPRQNRRRPLC